MKRVINLDKRLNESKFMNNRLESDEAVELYCNCPYPVREAANIEAKVNCRLWMKMVVDLLR